MINISLIPLFIKFLKNTVKYFSNKYILISDK